MADEAPTNPPDGGTVTPAPAATAPDGTVTKPSADEPTVSHRELVDFRREMREWMKVVQAAQKPGAKPAPQPEAKPEPTTPDGVAAQALAEVKALRRQLEVRDALDTSGITDPDHRTLIVDAIKGANPEDVSEFVGRYAAKLKPATVPAAPAASAAPPTPPPPATRPTKPPLGTPPPAADPKTATPDLLALTPEKLATLGEADLINLYEQAKASRGMRGNPFAAKLREIVPAK